MKKSLLSIVLALTFSLHGCSSLIEKPDSEMTVEEFYTEATTAFEEGNWDTAIQYYEKLKAYFPYGSYAEQSYLELAYAYYRYDEPESAIRELEEFIKLYPKHKQLAYAYYLKAVAADSIIKSWLDRFITDPAHRDIKSTDRAFNYYQELLTRFPDTDYARSASERLIIIRNRMARHEFQVAKFYYSKKAYLAAANRCRYLIEEYPRAVINLQALELMKDSYAALGMQQNYVDTLKVYELNLNVQQQAEEQALEEAPAPGSANKKQPSWWDKMSTTLDEIFD
ncbi:MAG: outer membrane protein assembly factor BamD [Thiomicrorhabdus chilensis]|uniref:outer membrane protein assembly factor BamD n=1 Tax=Thiomicrorhabdus chilensis TaxID=63656 RepID=UPI0004094E77|nr:outer membrane protein assembly factor BamD [Thiomicrorhabdus chilensis]MDX1347473.1 outer membrane protein assembly factor BamD [Thiomicrorhabdus chilensis]